MKKNIAVISTILSIVAFPTISLGVVPIDSGARFGDEAMKSRQLHTEIVELVRSSGYRCDSISALIKFNSSRGFNLTCNNYTYKYEIEDVGGRWKVTID